MWKDAAPSVAQQSMDDTVHETKGVAGLMWRTPDTRVPAPTQEQLEEIAMTKGGNRFVEWRSRVLVLIRGAFML